MGSPIAEHDELLAATRAFVDAVRDSSHHNLVTRKQMARTLDVATNTLSNWFTRYAPPDLERGGSTELSVNKRLGDLEELCGVTTGTFVALYRDITNARTKRQLKRSIPPGDDQYSGVTRVHRSFPSARFSRLMESARRVQMLNTWFPNLGELEQSLRRAVAKHCDIEITMLHPYCNAAVTRASTLGYTPGSLPLYSVAGEIRDSFRGLARIAEDSGCPDRIRVYVYPEIPALALYRADDLTLAGLFLHGRLAVDGPQLEISTPGSFMDTVVCDELARVRAGSLGPVPLADWEEWLNGNL